MLLSARSPRKLAVIVHADVVSSTTLVQQDESVAHDRIQGAFRRFSETITAYGGDAHEVRGDALVAVFERASDALSAALTFQAGNQTHNATLEGEIRPRLRIGISLGEVVIADNTLTGAGVVLAQRVEQLADPDGVCVTAAVHEAVPKRLPVEFIDIGKRDLKGFEEPVQGYRARIRPGTGIPPPESASRTGARRSSKKHRLLAGALIVVAIGGALALLRPWKPALEPAAIERMEFPLPDKPSIAVLPFTNMTDDPKQEYFVDGMTEDLITDLSKLSGLFVISRNSMFTYKGKPVRVRQVAEDLGVRYVLEGSVRRSGNRIRINAQLIDATTGGHLWAERYDREMSEVFALQDAITRRVVQALELHLTKTDRSRQSAQQTTQNVEAYDLVLKARKLMTRFNRKAADEARDLLEQSIELDPGYSEAYSLLGLYYFDQWRLWGQNRKDNLARALELGRTAAKLDPLDPSPHALLAQVHQFRREFQAASSEADAALNLEPNTAVTLANLGSMLRYANRPAEAVAVIERAIRLNPYHPPNYLEWLGDAYFLLDREECIEAVQRGIALDPEFIALHVVAAKCYAALGYMEKAQQAAAEILRQNPRFTLRAFASYVPFSDERVLRHNIEMLRMAGVPE